MEKPQPGVFFFNVRGVAREYTVELSNDGNARFVLLPKFGINVQTEANEAMTEFHLSDKVLNVITHGSEKVPEVTSVVHLFVESEQLEITIFTSGSSADINIDTAAGNAHATETTRQAHLLKLGLAPKK